METHTRREAHLAAVRSNFTSLVSRATVYVDGFRSPATVSRISNHSRGFHEREPREFFVPQTSRIQSSGKCKRIKYFCDFVRRSRIVVSAVLAPSSRSPFCSSGFTNSRTAFCCLGGHSN